MKDNQTYTIRKPVQHKIKVKRSLFIGSAASVRTRDEAELFLNRIRKEFHDATHNCYAYRIDENDFRSSDDGEPSGTAGKPILQVLEKNSVVQAALVVTRYFGGIKLGTGGLSRAYGQCAEETLQVAGLKPVIIYRRAKLIFPYRFFNVVEKVVKKHQGRIIDSGFKSGVNVRVEIPAVNYENFGKEIINSGAGNIQIEDAE
ncbi:MAG: YigZ family protein [Calditrichia bacterium]